MHCVNVTLVVDFVVRSENVRTF